MAYTKFKRLPKIRQGLVQNLSAGKVFGGIEKILVLL
jgi:hypothetical protein